jgi:hypothetical protein
MNFRDYLNSLNEDFESFEIDTDKGFYTQFRDIAKMIEYCRKGSDLETIVFRCKSINKMMARYVIAKVMGWDKVANAFKARCIEYYNETKLDPSKCKVIPKAIFTTTKKGSLSNDKYQGELNVYNKLTNIDTEEEFEREYFKYLDNAAKQLSKYKSSSVIKHVNVPADAYYGMQNDMERFISLIPFLKRSCSDIARAKLDNIDKLDNVEIYDIAVNTLFGILGKTRKQLAGRSNDKKDNIDNILRTKLVALNRFLRPNAEKIDVKEIRDDSHAYKYGYAFKVTIVDDDYRNKNDVKFNLFADEFDSNKPIVGNIKVTVESDEELLNVASAPLKKVVELLVKVFKRYGKNDLVAFDGKAITESGKNGTSRVLDLIETGSVHPSDVLDYIIDNADKYELNTLMDQYLEDTGY